MNLTRTFLALALSLTALCTVPNNLAAFTSTNGNHDAATYFSSFKGVFSYKANKEFNFDPAAETAAEEFLASLDQLYNYKLGSMRLFQNIIEEHALTLKTIFSDPHLEKPAAYDVVTREMNILIHRIDSIIYEQRVQGKLSANL